MEHNDNSLLREIHKLVKENNTMLHKMERNARRTRFWRTLRLAIMAGLLFGAYYLVQPFIDNLTNAYSSIQNSFEQLQETRDGLSNIGSPLSNLKKTQQ